MKEPGEGDLSVSLTLSPWLRVELVDPVSKQPFVRSDDRGFVAPCGLSYGFRNGAPDFRVGMAIGARKWAEGQAEFERWFDEYLDRGEREPDFYAREHALDGPMYEALPLVGRVLDVGGGLGHIRQYMNPGQEYCSIDPFTTAASRVRGRTLLFASYPLRAPLNLLGGQAEFLPLADASFDTVNMRSSIDHFYNPELALLEAYRVLRPGGRLIVGVSVEAHNAARKSDIDRGFRHAGRRIRNGGRRLIRGDFGYLVRRLFAEGRSARSHIVRRGPMMKQDEDHHSWHPTYGGLMLLCRSCGFAAETEIWQSNSVIYASFVREPQHTVWVD